MKFVTQFAFILSLALVLAGCSKHDEKAANPSVTNEEALWVVGEGQLNGNVAFGEVTGTKIVSVTIKNEGNNISGELAITGPFSLAFQNCDNLPAGKSCLVKLAFSAQGKDEGEHLGVISLGEYVGEISAYIPTPIIVENLLVTVNSIPVNSDIAFGNLTYKQSIIKTVVIINQSSNSFPLEVTKSGDFSIAYNNCPANLKINHRCTIKLLLVGSGKSGAITGELKIGSRTIGVQASVLGQLDSQIQNSVITYNQNGQSLNEGATLDLGTLNQNSKHSPTWLVKNTGTDSSLAFSLDILGAAAMPFNNCQNISLRPNQMCRFILEIPTEQKGIFSSQILKDNSPVVAIQYQVRSPGDTIDCTDQLENAESALITWTGTNYTACEMQSCLPNYTIANNECLPNSISCDIDFGTGEQTWLGNGYSECQVVSCQSDYHEFNNACDSDEISCIGTNGSGIRTWDGANYGDCVLNSCESEYHLNNISNTCDLNEVSCPVNHGTGIATWDGNNYGDCLVTSCQPNYHNYNNQCDLDVINCTGTNGTGTQTWNSSSSVYGSCVLNACSPDYHLNATNNTCDLNVIDCNITNGSGTQTWNSSTSTYGICTVANCTTGFHSENNQCLSNTKSCSFENGSGQQTWNSATSTYGACQYVSCNSGYTYEGGACINNRTCAITNGTGRQTWNGSAWGTCFIESCTSPFYDRGDNLTCVNTTRSVWNQGGFTLGQNGSTTLGSIRLVQQTDRHVVIYRGSTAIWASGTTGTCANNSCVMSFQGDGNLVSKQDNPFQLGFASGTSGQTGLTFTLKDDCPYYLVIHNSQRKAIWTNRNIGTSYYPNQGCGF